MKTTEFDFKIDEVDVYVFEISAHKIVDFKGFFLDFVQLPFFGKPQREYVIIVYQRVSQRVVLVAKFQNGAFQRRALLQS